MRGSVRRLGMAVAVLSAIASATVLAPSQALAAAYGGSCVAKRGAALPLPRTIIVDTHESLNAWRIAGGKVRVSSVSWSFTNARAEWLKPTVHTVWLKQQPYSNIAVKAGGVTRWSTASGGSSGTGNFTDFDVTAGTTIAVTVTPAVQDESDPTCTAYITVS